MYFSIPVAEQQFDDEANQKGAFTAFKLYLNGGFLCYVRFSRLLELNEQVSFFSSFFLVIVLLLL